MKSRIVHLKIKIKSLAAEARIIREEEKKAGPALRYSLWDHRVTIVRDEARWSLLAYGFLRGKPYSAMESKTKSEPHWDRVRDLAIRFGSVYNPAVADPKKDLQEQRAKLAEDFGAWLRVAREVLLAA